MEERNVRTGREPSTARTHSLTLTDRRQLSVAGVVRVESFDDRSIVLETDQGLLTIRGEGLGIQQLDLESGTFTCDGSVASLTYSAVNANRGKSWLERVMR